MIEHGLRVDVHDIADAPQVVLDAVDDDAAAAAPEQSGVFAGQPRGDGPVRVDLRHELRVDLPVSTMRTTEIASVLVTR